MNKYNLINLLSDTIEISEGETLKRVKLDGIKVPIIQRDYAQGRKNEKIIRDRFLSAIFEALDNNRELELDFVYGSIKINNNDEKVFLPLDGQQRLTTLYLLYWFVGNKELKDQELTDLRKKLLGFTYATRTTATAFCEKLAEINFKEDPSKEIRKSYWFHKRFEKDPTVIAMLNMLDAIKIKYDEINKPIFSNLNKLCFYILPLDGFELTDELYIKMNARGKQLTDFENLKADLNNWLISDSNKMKENFQKEINYNSLSIPYYLVLLSKIDNEWTNIFWNHLLKLKDSLKNEEEKEKMKMVVDPFFMNFISRYIVNTYILESTKTNLEIEISIIFRFFYNEAYNQKYNSFDMYEEVFKQDNVIQNLEKTLDTLAQNYQEIAEIIKPIWNKGTNWSLTDERINQQQRILFCGICLYLEKKTFEPTYFANWIRVVWNLAIDPDIRSIGPMINTMKLIKELSIGSENIYTYFATQEFQDIINNRKDFFKTQLEEEKIKASLIIDPNWEEYILKAESHPLFLGNIGFLINDNPEIDLFKKRIENAFLLFDNSGSNKSFSSKHDLFRYLISKFSNWNQIQNFIYSDSENNWRLILRRDTAYKNKQFIKEICSLDSIDKIKEHITAALLIESSATGWNTDSVIKVRKAHTNLYFDTGFCSWMQTTGANKVKLLQEYIYIIRPGAWYDKVMIDCFRNELITLALVEFKLNSEGKQCGNSMFFKEENIKFTKHIGDRLFVIIFGATGYFTIKEKINEDWIEIISENYTKISAIDELTIFMNNYKNKLETNVDKELIRLFE
ncbi:DUF262 domain-containing protein [Flavobacterium humidisoli]|uniref:DUF262 domain-containing protein n=1 Tax=Flavobacterium humidisoli TaxID=2937442 RepID=A0ABY4LUL5_9FLAO|nr:DUF262 domain-containing protein [Flavobacterium humidisoli]UPZ16248.1 DUF262 domain-containing protein [Flavobacterium humidisoli]